MYPQNVHLDILLYTVEYIGINNITGCHWQQISGIKSYISISIYYLSIFTSNLLNVLVHMFFKM